MPTRVRVRSRRSEDLAQAEALWSRVGPYRPGDEAEVEAMFERARQAKEAGDRSWMGRAPAAARENSAERTLAGWVAVVPSETGGDRVVGIVGVLGVGALPHMPFDMPLARERRGRSDVAQLTRLSVEPELWRRGVGTRLTHTAIDWCRDHGFHTLVVNTSPPQKPALSLYRKLGFREAGRSFLDKYELVWLELTPNPPKDGV